MTKLQVLQVTPKSGISKSNKPYAFQICKAVVTLDDGSVDVGEIVLFDIPTPILPGVYSPVFAVKRSQDGKLEGAIVGLAPFVATTAKAA